MEKKNCWALVRSCYPWLLGLGLLSLSCSSHHDTSSPPDTDDAEATTGYADGTYCAQVDYYYAASGTSSTYTLLVDVEDNRLVKIHWPNGGWLDETHYSGPDIEDGNASFTSDAGVDYTVRIEGEEGSCTTSTSAVGETAVIQEYEDQTQAQTNAENLTHSQQEEADEQEQARQQEEDRRQRQQAEEEQEAARREREEATQRAQQEEQGNTDASGNE